METSLRLTPNDDLCHTSVAHFTLAGLFVQGNLEGLILSHVIFCSACCLCQAKLVYNSHHITLYVAMIVVGS